MNERVKVRELLALNPQQISNGVRHLRKISSTYVYVPVQDYLCRDYILEGTRHRGGIVWSIMRWPWVKAHRATY